MKDGQIGQRLWQQNEGRQRSCSPVAQIQHLAYPSKAHNLEHIPACDSEIGQLHAPEAQVYVIGEIAGWPCTDNLPSTQAGRAGGWWAPASGDETVSSTYAAAPLTQSSTRMGGTSAKVLRQLAASGLAQGGNH